MEVPYFRADSLVVAASLSGGMVFSTLVDALRGWMQELDIPGDTILSKTQLYERLMGLAGEKLDTSLSVQVSLWGERHDPGQEGAVSNVNPGNLSLGDISSAMFRGIMENLRTMMPDEVFQSLKVTADATNKGQGRFH
jgi:sedoheptulokinase